VRGCVRFVLFLFAGLLLGAAGAAVPPAGPADMALGRPDAPVTVIEYGSLTCPHCAAFDQGLFPRIKAEWVDTGKIRFVFRDYPRDRVDLKAFQLAHCEQGRLFWPLIDAFFEEQPNWVRSRSPDAELIRLGHLAGLPEAAAHACLADQSLARASAASGQGGSRAGVTGTPTFFVNGQKIALWEYTDWQRALTEAGAR
jgi:protein-disulfide isomerase